MNLCQLLHQFKKYILKPKMSNLIEMAKCLNTRMYLLLLVKVWCLLSPCTHSTIAKFQIIFCSSSREHDASSLFELSPSFQFTVPCLISCCNRYQGITRAHLNGADDKLNGSVIQCVTSKPCTI